MNALMTQPYVEMVHQHAPILMVHILVPVLPVIQMEGYLLLLVQKLMNALLPLVFVGWELVQTHQLAHTHALVRLELRAVVKQQLVLILTNVQMILPSVGQLVHLHV